LVLYGLLGLVGFGLAHLLGLPPMFREKAGWRAWFWQPLVIGLALGVILVVLDRLFAFAGGTQGFSHPQFPLSILASGTAGIGEEILFRLFVLSLWAWLADLVLRRWQARNAALWIGNVVAALAFAAAHLPAAMGLGGVSDPLQLPPLVLVELFLLNGIIGLVCGQRSWKNGLVAAIGIHFWADIVWHVVWPLIGLG
ncbi:MAG: type II CAAX prenyl endopeptidase Rce1 family protein, partial [Rudaea sp.]